MAVRFNIFMTQIRDDINIQYDISASHQAI